MGCLNPNEVGELECVDWLVRVLKEAGDVTDSDFRLEGGLVGGKSESPAMGIVDEGVSGTCAGRFDGECSAARVPDPQPASLQDLASLLEILVVREIGAGQRELQG